MSRPPKILDARSKRPAWLLVLVLIFPCLGQATETAPDYECSSNQFSELELVHYSPPRFVSKIAVSLKNIQTAVENRQVPGSMELPISRIRGIIVTGDDVIIKGVEERGQTAVKIKVDDLIVAFRTIVRQDQPPGVSIDPVLDNGVMADFQDVVYFGAIKGSEFGRVAFSTDYWMKKVAAGKARVNIKGFCSYYDRVKNEAFNHIGQWSLKGTRFWFYPKESEILISKTRDSMNLTGGGVELLSEFQHLSRQQRKALPSNSTSANASGFAKQMTKQLEELGVVFPDLIRLRNYFALSEIFTWLKPKIGNRYDWQYLLYEYHPIPVYGQSKVKTVRGAPLWAGGKSYVLQGGVNIAVRLPRKPKIDQTQELTRETEMILAARPSKDAAFWTY